MCALRRSRNPREFVQLERLLEDQPIERMVAPPHFCIDRRRQAGFQPDEFVDHQPFFRIRCWRLVARCDEIRLPPPRRPSGGPLRARVSAAAAACEMACGFPPVIARSRFGPQIEGRRDRLMSRPTLPDTDHHWPARSQGPIALEAAKTDALSRRWMKHRGWCRETPDRPSPAWPRGSATHSAVRCEGVHPSSRCAPLAGMRQTVRPFGPSPVPY